MTAAKLADTAKWLGRRLATFGLYRIFLRLGATAMFLWWAVDRTIAHWHEDQEHS